MEKLPNSLLNKLMNGEHVVHLMYLLSNEIWSDMAIETTYMKFEKVFNEFYKLCIFYANIAYIFKNLQNLEVIYFTWGRFKNMGHRFFTKKKKKIRTTSL